MTYLCDLARKYGTDKGGGHGERCHNYTPIYYSLFEPIRHEVKAVLEIGINSGASLRMWRDFFPNANIIGIDNDRGCQIGEDRIVSFIADQYNVADLHQVIPADAIFDIIIDDGAHQLRAWRNSFEALRRNVRPGGYYIIEDCLHLIADEAAEPWRDGLLIHRA